MGGLEGSELKEETFTMQSGLQFKLFHRDAGTVLKKQIASLSKRNLKTVPTKLCYFPISLDAEPGKILF